MESLSDYITLIKSIRPSKRLGQNFLINRDIARNEAMYGAGKTVLEVGPGLGMLTEELCAVAKRVIAVEKDRDLFSVLATEMSGKNLKLISGDFFDVKDNELKDCDIMISNIPYGISSKIAMWLVEQRMPALLCLQKEFVDHMTAEPGEKSYSKLSVFTSLCLDVSIIRKVPAANFYPKPAVDSSIIFLRPKKTKVTQRELQLITLLMEHKKKKIRNAIHDSAKALGISKDSALALSEKVTCKDERAFQIGPEHLLEAAKQMEGLL